jgi:hypothetical protein
MDLKLFKRKEVPQELPDLATDTLAKTNSVEKKDQEIVSSYLKEKEYLGEPKKAGYVVEQKKDNEQLKKDTSQIMDSGFFSKLQGDMNKEMDNVKKLEEWYNNKFLPQDSVSSMKKYWANQKGGPMGEVIHKKFKEQINEKTARLQKIEKEWQDLYFQLIEKEEELKEGERELKKILAEFVDIYKEKKKGKKKA